MNKVIKYIGIFFLVIIVLLILVGCTSTNSNDTSTNTNNPVSVEDMNKKEIVSTNFNDYGQIYCDSSSTDLQRESLFNDNYKNKYVTWSGTVSSVSLSGDKITLNVNHCPSEWGSPGATSVIMKEDQKSKLVQLKEGDKVTYTARLKSYGHFLGLSADDGELV